MIDEGQPAPDFELASDSGEPVRLSSLRGSPVVLYFDPKDDSPGTLELFRSTEGVLRSARTAPREHLPRFILPPMRPGTYTG